MIQCVPYNFALFNVINKYVSAVETALKAQNAECDPFCIDLKNYDTNYVDSTTYTKNKETYLNQIKNSLIEFNKEKLDQQTAKQFSDRSKLILKPKDTIVACGYNYLTMGAFLDNISNYEIYVPLSETESLESTISSLQQGSKINSSNIVSPINNNYSNFNNNINNNNSNNNINANNSYEGPTQIFMQQNANSVKRITNESVAAAIRQCDCLLIEPEIAFSNGNCVVKSPVVLYAQLAKHFQKPVYCLIEQKMISKNVKYVNAVLSQPKVKFDVYHDVEVFQVDKQIMDQNLIDYYVTATDMVLPKFLFRLAE